MTGSDSGIGRAIAEAFAMEGADVAITYHSDEYGATEAANQVRAQGRRAIEHRLDVRNEDSVAELFRRVEEELGARSTLVNNAGKATSGTPVADMDTIGFDDVIKTPANSYAAAVTLAAWAKSSTLPRYTKPSQVLELRPMAPQKGAY